MSTHAQISVVASLIGEPARTSILVALADGRARTAGELAYMSHVSPQAASAHLAKLADGGLLHVERQGRHRYFRLASPEVAHILEAIAAIAPPKEIRSLRESDKHRQLSFGRTCYDHLAGELGVAMTEALLCCSYLQSEPEGYTITPSGEAWFHSIGVKWPVKRGVPVVAPRHIDWTERTHHIGGPAAVALTKRLIELGWIERGRVPRSISVTELGEQAFYQQLGLQVSELRTYPSK